jgi:FkbM family methyltransferase
MLSVEIGAHEASFSERLKKCIPGVYALAFEANPVVYGRHVDRLRQLTIDYKNAAVCDEDGVVEFFIPTVKNGVSFDPGAGISSLSRRASAEFEHDRVLVSGFKLDTALKSLAVDRSVAWIDAEGAQGKILAGGFHYFSGVSALYIEVERERYWCGQLLDSEIVDRLAEFSLIPVMRDNLASGQYNGQHPVSTAASSLARLRAARK